MPAHNVLHQGRPCQHKAIFWLARDDLPEPERRRSRSRAFATYDELVGHVYYDPSISMLRHRRGR